jgi:foldase protein PrsA
MRRYVRRTAALGAFFAVCAVVAGCGSGVPGNSVADMAGNPITTQAFNHWMFVAAKSQASQSPGAPVIVPNDPPNFDRCIAQARRQIPSLAKTSTKQLRSDCKQLFTSLMTQVMDFLIKGYWYQAEAAREHITVTQAQIQKAINAAKAQQFSTPAQFTAFLTQTGQTTDDIQFRFRINQLYTKLLAKHTTKITQADIQNYYSTHPTQFGTPENRDIRIVLAKTLSQAKAAKAALASAQSWNSVVKKYSTDPTSRKTGGLLKGVVKGEEDAALDKAAFAAPLNKLMGPIKGQFGYYVFEVTNVKKPTHQTLAQATPLIRQTLTGQQQTTAQSAVEKAASKDWRGQTKCRSGFLMNDCSGYKAPKASTATTPTTTG